MKTRKHNFLNAETHEVLYGVQVEVEGQWLNAKLDGVPVLCKTEAERDKARKQIQVTARNVVKKAKAK